MSKRRSTQGKRCLGCRINKILCFCDQIKKHDTKTIVSIIMHHREKHLTSVRTAGKDEQPILPPIVNRTLEWALDWIDNDEWVEITPQSIRIRKKELVGNKRSVVRKG